MTFEELKKLPPEKQFAAVLEIVGEQEFREAICRRIEEKDREAAAAIEKMPPEDRPSIKDFFGGERIG